VMVGGKSFTSPADEKIARFRETRMQSNVHRLISIQKFIQQAERS
jgi:hypothetical protein